MSAPLEDDKQGRSRIEIARDNGEDTAPLPSNPAPYLTEWLFEIGPMSGEGTLSWSELRSWQDVSGVTLLPFEARILRHLSATYSKERFSARKPDRPMPYNLRQEDIEAMRDGVSAKVARLFA